MQMHINMFLAVCIVCIVFIFSLVGRLVVFRLLLRRFLCMMRWFLRILLDVRFLFLGFLFLLWFFLCSRCVLLIGLLFFCWLFWFLGRLILLFLLILRLFFWVVLFLFGVVGFGRGRLVGFWFFEHFIFFPWWKLGWTGC